MVENLQSNLTHNAKKYDDSTVIKSYATKKYATLCQCFILFKKSFMNILPFTINNHSIYFLFLTPPSTTPELFKTALMDLKNTLQSMANPLQLVDIISLQ